MIQKVLQDPVVPQGWEWQHLLCLHRTLGKILWAPNKYLLKGCMNE